MHYMKRWRSNHPGRQAVANKKWMEANHNKMLAYKRKWVEANREHLHPKSVSLDHVTPVSKGGSHTRDNTQATHLLCNQKKHNN